MGNYIVKRILLLIPVVLGITVLVFFIIRLIPGDPAAIMLGQEATPESIAVMRETLGLNDNIFLQFFKYLQKLFTLNLGDSIFLRTSVWNVIKDSFPATLELAVVAMIISLIIAVPLGILSAVKQNSPVDYIGMIFAQVGVSMPVFWIGLLLILLFSVQLGWLPSFGRGVPILEGIGLLFQGNGAPLLDSLKRIFLPAFSLGLMGSAMISRMIRSSMLEVLNSDYVRTARAKGTVERRVILGHAFRNALLPVVTTVGLQFGSMLGGSIVTENVFAWPGMGRIIVTAISQRDFPVVQGGVIFFALAFAMVNLCVDLLYAVIDPKIRS